MLLQNIRVIATDQNAKGADGQPVIARTATLEVDPIEAQKLALAQQVGQLSLILRKPGEDQNTAGVRTVSLNDLRYSYYGASYPAAAPPVEVHRLIMPRRARPVMRAPAGPRTENVQVVRGTVGNSYEVGGYNRKALKRAALIGVAGLTALAAAAPVAAQSSGISVAEDIHAGELVVPVNKSQVLRSDRPYSKALIGDPEIADVLPLTNQSLYVLGKKNGTTSLNSTIGRAD